MNNINSIEGRGGAIDIHKLIGRLPRPKRGFTLPGHRYTGPYNPLGDQLDSNDNPVPGQEPYNKVDKVSMFHDICYRDVEDKGSVERPERTKKECDKTMLTSLKEMKPKGIRERFDRALVSALIGTKYKLGIGLNDKGGTKLDRYISRRVT